MSNIKDHNYRDPFASRRGQSLVEALVALTILMTGFIGITTLLTKSFQLNRLTMNETQATYLAAEDIEVAKNIIDNDVYSGIAAGGNGASGWDTSFSKNGYYQLEYDSTGTAGIFSVNAPNSPLYFNPNTKLYELNDTPGDVPTDFTRNVQVINKPVFGSPSGRMIDVQSTVVWNDGIQSNSVTLEDQFYDWQP